MRKLTIALLAIVAVSAHAEDYNKRAVDICVPQSIKALNSFYGAKQQGYTKEQMEQGFEDAENIDRESIGGIVAHRLTMRGLRIVYIDNVPYSKEVLRDFALECIRIATAALEQQ